MASARRACNAGTAVTAVDGRWKTPRWSPKERRKRESMSWMRLMLLLELQIKLKRHSTGSWRSTRMPGSAAAMAAMRGSAAAQSRYRPATDTLALRYSRSSGSQARSSEFRHAASVVFGVCSMYSTWRPRAPTQPPSLPMPPSFVASPPPPGKPTGNHWKAWPAGRTLLARSSSGGSPRSTRPLRATSRLAGPRAARLTAPRCARWPRRFASSAAATPHAARPPRGAAVHGRGPGARATQSTAE
mmetsp:Transcript_34433/g.109339  ORF Transcript_34433/g.109339 Transcript_34433/m.109339 type:complete len:244 (+) Transcript_34433:605-1336(+)